MKTWIAIAAVLVAQTAMADDIRLGNPGYGGTGCPGGTVSATLSPDAKTLSIIFDQYVTEVVPGAGRTIDRKNCQLAIPVHVPQGMSVSILSMEYRGFNSLPSGARSTLSVQNFIPGVPGAVRFSKTFMGPQDDEYVVNDSLGLGAIVWSPCGADINLRMSTSVALSSRNRYESALSTLDSIDVDAGLLYHLQWRTCR